MRILVLLSGMFFNVIGALADIHQPDVPSLVKKLEGVGGFGAGVSVKKVDKVIVDVSGPHHCFVGMEDSKIYFKTSPPAFGGQPTMNLSRAQQKSAQDGMVVYSEELSLGRCLSEKGTDQGELVEGKQTLIIEALNGDKPIFRIHTTYTCRKNDVERKFDHSTVCDFSFN